MEFYPIVIREREREDMFMFSLLLVLGRAEPEREVSTLLFTEEQLHKQSSL